jgi:hypothetical protein
MYNSVLAWPTIVVPDTEPLETLGGAVTAICAGSEGDNRLAGVAGITESVGSYISILLSGCSTSVMMIAPPRNAWLSQDRLSKTLPQTFRRRLKFVDSHAEQWNRVLRYLEPVFQVIQEDDLEEVRQLAADLYELCLGAQLGAEVDVDPADDVDLISTLLEQRYVRDEARARLAVLRGLFAGAEMLGPVVGLQGVPGSAAFVANAIDEILDDAEFLQASALRRWFNSTLSLFH